MTLTESLAECSLGFTYVCVVAVDVTRDIIHGSTLVFFRCFVFRVYYHRAEGVCRLVVHVTLLNQCKLTFLNTSKERYLGIWI